MSCAVEAWACDNKLCTRCHSPLPEYEWEPAAGWPDDQHYLNEWEHWGYLEFICHACAAASHAAFERKRADLAADIERVNRERETAHSVDKAVGGYREWMKADRHAEVLAAAESFIASMPADAPEHLRDQVAAIIRECAGHAGQQRGRTA